MSGLGECILFVENQMHTRTNVHVIYVPSYIQIYLYLIHAYTAKNGEWKA